MNDLSPREQAIVALALGRSPLYIAHELDVPEAAVRRVGGLLGWPGDSRQIKRAASAIHAGERLWAGELAERPGDVEPVGQAQPAPEATARQLEGCPEDCGGCSCHLSAPCHHCTDVPPDRYVFDDPTDSVECVACGAQVSRWSASAFEGRPFCRPCATATPNPNDQGDPMPKPTPDEADALAVLADVDKLATTTDRAVLTMPLTRLVDIDGTETVLAEAVVEVQLDREQVLVLLMEEEGNALRSPVTAYVSRRLTPDGAAAIRTLAALLPPDADR